MVPVTLFEVDGEYGVRPSKEIETDDELADRLGRFIEPATALACR
ncbi:hypothetical protein [Sinorhizobium americanum]|nr:MULTISPECIES: hypothetical protein [Sinorhizobium]